MMDLSDDTLKPGIIRQGSGHSFAVRSSDDACRSANINQVPGQGMAAKISGNPFSRCFQTLRGKISLPGCLPARTTGRLGAVFLLLCLLAGCAATQVALEKKDLKVETQMSDSIFLDISNRGDKTVYLDVRNTSDKDIDVTPYITSRLEEKGYFLTWDPQEAFYVVQANVLYVGMADPSALRQSVFQGWGGIAGGAAAGATVAEMANSRTLEGAGIGGLVGGFAEILTGSVTKDVTYTIMTDVQILERSPYPVTQTRQAQLKQGKDVSIVQSSSHITDRYIYQTRIASSANQVNLELEDALPQLMEGIGRSIAGIF